MSAGVPQLVAPRPFQDRFEGLSRDSWRRVAI
jgi:hypothetical protein